MTGYGYGEKQNEKMDLILEIKTYNNRYLDIVINLPPFLNPLEQRIRDFLNSHMRRGRIEVYVRIREAGTDLEISLNESAVNAYVDVLTRLSDLAQINEAIRISHLLRMEDIIKTEHTRDVESYWEVVYPLLEDVYRDVEKGRISEGKATEKDILRELDSLEENHHKIKQNVTRIEQLLRGNLEQRFKELLDQDIDEQRMYTEIAVLLMKYTINEELNRLETHFSNFREITASHESIGKKLDFLCQEINREINTIGSKNILSEVSMMVVNMKDSVENIREQLRNIE